MATTAHSPLVTADRVEADLDAYVAEPPTKRLLEVDMEPAQYDESHIPGAIKIDWEADLAGELGRDIVDRAGFEALMSRLGVATDTDVVIYGDQANWFAAHAYWLFRYYGHEKVSLLDGGRHYWLANEYPTTTEPTPLPRQEYVASDPDESIRADRDEVETAIDTDTRLVDVRSPKEYRGDETAPPGAPETTDTGGHIPGAENISWGDAVNFDGTFKKEAALADLYGDVDDNITYCRIGERSSLTWFILHELLGQDAANYDGSWTEWTEDEAAAVERGE